jgi:hypothetical protein
MRKDAAHPHPDKIRVLAVVPDPLVQLRLVRALDIAAVDVAVVPAVAEPPEALAKSAAVSGRIAEGQPTLSRSLRQIGMRHADMTEDGSRITFIR